MSLFYSFMTFLVLLFSLLAAREIVGYIRRNPPGRNQQWRHLRPA